MHLESTSIPTTAAATARERSDLLTQVETLREALVTSRGIGAAIGLLMAREGVTYEGAFALLCERSSHTNVKLHDVAAELVRDANSLAGLEQCDLSVPGPRAHAVSNGLGVTSA